MRIRNIPFNFIKPHKKIYFSHRQYYYKKSNKNLDKKCIINESLYKKENIL